MHWKVVLSNNEIVEEGKAPWIQVPGESLPWRKLCEFCADNYLYIDHLFIITDEKEFHIAKDLKPNSFSIQNDVIVNNILSNSDTRNLLHVAAHETERDIHYIFDDELLVNIYYDDPKKFTPLVSSPKKEGNNEA